MTRAPIRPKYIERFKDRHGKARLYFRRKDGPRIPLQGELGTEEFAASYRAAMATEAGLVAVSKMAGGIRTRPKAVVPGTWQPLIGVYLLMLKGKLVYIGSSLNMPNRVVAHRANGRSFDRAFYIATKANEREELERTLIRTLHPAQNTAHRVVVGPKPDLPIVPNLSN